VQNLLFETKIGTERWNLQTLIYFQVPFWSRKVPGVILSISTVLLMVALVLAAVFGVILYRMSMIAALNLVDQVHDSAMIRQMQET
jgi:hypothetical protein